jgi:hypothetical protein
MLTGRENYFRTIEFKSPAYLPTTLGKMWVDLDWLYEKDEAKLERIHTLQARFPDDLLGPLNPARNRVEPSVQNGVSRWVDEWGTAWADHGNGAKPEFYPLAEGYQGLDSYVLPDPHLPARFTQIDAQLETRADLYVLARVWFTLFERFWMLRGFENALIDPYLEPAGFARLRDRILEYDLATIDKLLQRKVDAIYFSDDWGSQQSLLIRPDDWRRFYKPAYKAMFDKVRSAGAHVWMHLCGNISAILPDLVDLGLSVLNPVQPQALDVRWLSREFGGKICFHGGVDVQGTLVNGASQDVKDEVHMLVGLLGKFNGGYIGNISHTIMPETPLDNVIAMYEAFLEYI